MIIEFRVTDTLATLQPEIVRTGDVRNAIRYAAWYAAETDSDLRDIGIVAHGKVDDDWVESGSRTLAQLIGDDYEKH